ncbi:MAG: hypothetical protein ACFE9I_14395 [Candidatus Hermodarchaeota archaeon]
METQKLLNPSKTKSFNNKQEIADKIDSLWGERLSKDRNTKYESKKLTIKLESKGKEKRKILLKMESGTPKVHSSNYNLISQLLKEFFNGSNNFE